jgi:hypothetical protein
VLDDIEYYTKVYLLSAIFGASPITTTTGNDRVFLSHKLIEELPDRLQLGINKDLPLANHLSHVMVRTVLSPHGCALLEVRKTGNEGFRTPRRFRHQVSWPWFVAMDLNGI